MFRKITNVCMLITIVICILTIHYVQISRVQTTLETVENTVKHLSGAMSDTCDRVGYIEHMLEVE